MARKTAGRSKVCGWALAGVLASPVLGAEEGTRASARDRVVGPARHEPAYARAALEMLGVLSLGTAEYWANAKKNARDWDYPRWTDRWSSNAIRFDNNTHVTNNLLHPLGGAGYYGLARINGLSVGVSALYTWTSSAIWEWGLEWREKPSINDMITTTIGGIATGEFIAQLASYLNSAPATTNLAQDVAKTTLGLPVWVHDQLDRREPDTRPATDSLGFSSWYHHRFELAYRNIWLDDAVDAASEQQIGGVALNAQLVSLPGYLEPETFDVVFAQGNFTSGSLALHFDAGGYEEARVAFDAVLFGYYAQRWYPGVLGALVGLATGIEFLDRDTLDRGDQYAIVHCLGPQLGTVWSWNGIRLQMRLRGFGDFATIRSLAWPALKRSEPEAVYKSSLDRQYQFHVGFSTRADAELRVHAARLYAGLGWGSYRSIQGLDRFQERITRDPAGSETLEEYRVGLALEPPKTPLQFSGEFERSLHQSSLAEHEAERQERRVILGLGLVF